MRIALVVVMLCGVARADGVQGNVVDGRGRPIAGASVWIVGESLEVVTYADARGAFFVDGLPHEHYAIEVEHGYSVDDVVTLDRPPPASAGITIEPDYRCVLPLIRMTFDAPPPATIDEPVPLPHHVPMIDTSSTSVGITASGDAITSL
ncbi:MAG TPA: carboxypeptidase-like regulatory domain-containing protein [Kofleriaceae bacterium]|jgi:hypothetical protein